jgi:glycerophosphoryl diester phosphodiesterase
LVIAHRGASGERPENTLPAYELAIEQRADMIEIDLHRTADGAIVIAHDDRLPGLSGDGAIGGATLAEVRALVLDEVLDGFAGRIPFNLEIKRGHGGCYPGLEAEALAALRARGLGAAILFSSFEDAVLAELRALSDRARLGVLVSPRASAGWLERCAAVGAEAVHFEQRLATPPAIGAAHERGLAVYVYTVDAPAQMGELLARGCDGLFTNHPARMRRLVDAMFP